jgi:glycosyltransferase involved in cell wall biosynthesis
MTEKIHILHIETGRHLYGGALQVYYLMKGIAENGCKNTIVCPSGSDIAKANTPGTLICSVPMRGELDILFLSRLCRIMMAVQPNLVHVHSRRGADIWGAVAARFTHTPVIITRRVDNPENPFIARLKYRFYRRIVTISERIRQVLLAEGIPAKKIACIPSAVDAECFRTPCDREWFLSEFGLEPTHRTIGMIAQFIPRKGHRFLIAAVPGILARCPEARFLFFGKGPLEKDLRQQCIHEHIEDRIIFAGFRNDLERILPCLDIVVHPATLEGLGVSLLQAAASGVPIVATRAGGIPEIVEDGNNGYLIDSGDIQAIIHRVTDLLADPIKSKRFGAISRNKVASRFSIDAMVNSYLSVYREVLSEQVSENRIDS